MMIRVGRGPPAAFGKWLTVPVTVTEPRHRDSDGDGRRGRGPAAGRSPCRDSGCPDAGTAGQPAACAAWPAGPGRRHGHRRWQAAGGPRCQAGQQPSGPAGPSQAETAVPHVTVQGHVIYIGGDHGIFLYELSVRPIRVPSDQSVTVLVTGGGLEMRINNIL